MNNNLSKNERIRFIIAFIINVIVFGLAVYCLISLSISAANGNNRFIYFTNISNLFVGFLSIVNAILLLISITKNRSYIPTIFSLIKIVAISMTTLTFFTVLFVIGPIDGYQKNYSGRNFFTHLVVPLLSLVSYFFFEEKLQLEWKYSTFVLIPLIIYSIIYVINVVMFKTWPDIYQINKQGLWYLYLLTFLVMDFGIGEGLYFLKKIIDKKSRPPWTAIID